MTTESAPNRSARIMGQEHGLTATEMNFLLKDEGFLEGGPGVWAVTEKGKQYADEQDHHRGTGGYSWYNRDWETRTWDPSITDELDITNERRQQVREAARAARQQKADLRAAQAAEFDSAYIDDGEPNDSGPDPFALAVGLVFIAVSIYGITKLARRLKTLRIDKVAPQHAKLRNRTAGDTKLKQRHLTAMKIHRPEATIGRSVASRRCNAAFLELATPIPRPRRGATASRQNAWQWSSSSFGREEGTSFATCSAE